MPIRKCASQNCFNRNVAAEIRSGKKPAQAVAIAKNIQRKAKLKKYK